MLEPPQTNATVCCAQCSYQTVWPFQLDHHIQRKHKNLNSTRAFHGAVQLEMYVCTCWSYKKCKLGRCEHCEREHDAGKSEMYPCHFCLYKGHSSLHLIKHLDSCGMTRKDSTSWFNCTECSYRAKQRKYLKNHVRTHHTRDIETLNCTKCSFRAVRKHHLFNHMRLHDAPKRFSCTKCSYHSQFNLDLTRHMLTHDESAEIKWFCCTECSHRTKQKKNLKTHMLTHAAPEEIAWFNCSKCSYRAKNKGSVKRHMLGHVSNADIKWFQCTECPYRAKFITQWNQHVKLNHARAEEIIWFSCEKCSYRTKRKPGLKRHMTTHEKFDWFSCAECSYRTKVRNHLKAHILRHAPSGSNVTNVFIES